MIQTAQAQTIATRLIEFLETGVAPEGLFADDLFLDFSLPKWRLQAQGKEAAIAMRLQGHPGQGKVPRWRCDPTPSGFVLEVEERWSCNGRDWYCRELLRADLSGDSIAELSVYCTGDWDSDLEEQHRRMVSLLRP